MTLDGKSRFKQRMEARREAEEGLSEGDQETLSCYAEYVEKLISLLEEEEVALKEGRLDLLEGIFERKGEIVRLMEIKMPIMELLISKQAPEVESLRERSATLRDRAAQVSLVVERMTAATSAVAREIEKIQDRHSLNGLYASDGRKRRADRAPQQRIDESL
jgi:flagellar biosynthesis/type III secretory pathway chaperone